MTVKLLIIDKNYSLSPASFCRCMALASNSGSERQEAERLVDLSEFLSLLSLTFHAGDEAGVDEFNSILTAPTRHSKRGQAL